MIRLFAVFFLLFVFSAASFGAQMVTSDNPFESKVEISVTTKDTLAGVDSQTIKTKWIPAEKSWHYALENHNISGAGSDSVLYDIWIDAYNYNDSLLGRYFVDSSKVAYCKPIFLHLNNGIFGAKFTIKAIARTGNGGEVITTGWDIVRFKQIK